MVNVLVLLGNQEAFKTVSHILYVLLDLPGAYSLTWINFTSGMDK